LARFPEGTKQDRRFERLEQWTTALVARKKRSKPPRLTALQRRTGCAGWRYSLSASFTFSSPVNRQDID